MNIMTFKAESKHLITIVSYNVKKKWFSLPKKLNTYFEDFFSLKENFFL